MAETAVAKVDERVKSVQAVLLSKGMQEQLRYALPKHITPERLARIALTQFRRIPKLLDCSRDSFLGALMECAQLGLEPGVLGQAWILPYKGSAQLIVGYRGMVALAWRSSQVSSIQAHEVYEGDKFIWSFGLNPTLVHEPDAEGEQDPEAITHVYAVVQTINHGTLFDVMTRKQVDAVRKRSQSPNNGPWATDFAEMAKKTVLKRLLKLAPLSAEMQRAMQLDEAVDNGDPQQFAVDVDFGPAERIHPEPSSIDDVLDSETSAESVPDKPANGNGERKTSLADVPPALTKQLMNRANSLVAAKLFADSSAANAALIAHVVEQCGDLKTLAAKIREDKRHADPALNAILDFQP